MSTEIVLTVPARHLKPGDHTAGFVVSQVYNFPDGSREFRFVVPSTTHYMTVTVREQDLDAVSFPLTKRGDDYSPNVRNAALGLPPAPEKVYVAPEPIAHYPAGSLLKDVKHFDRSMHIRFKCPEHNIYYSSKDPYVSHWFAASADGAGCPEGCQVPKNEFVLTHDYKPTRNG